MQAAYVPLRRNIRVSYISNRRNRTRCFLAVGTNQGIFAIHMRALIQDPDQSEG